MNRVQQQHGQDYSSRMSKRQKIRMYRGVIVTVAVLAACLIADMAWSSAKAASYGTGEDESGHIIIYQVYGRGDNTDAAISHSFIELYNPTESDVPLDEWSLQYTAEGGKWKILPLKGVIPSRSSFLVRCFTVDGIASRYTVSKYDMDWGFRKISNNGYKVALVGPGGELAEADPSQGDDIVDFVGVGDTDFGDGPTVGGISKQKAVRRVSVKDTNDNAADFEVIDYRDRRLSDDILDLVRPRTAAEGAWDPAVSKLEGTLLFSAPAGLYSAPFSLSLSTTFADGVIRYTTDGTAPTARSPVFSGGIAIDDRTGEPERLANISNITKRGADPPTEKVFKGACVKARVYTKAGEPLSPVITQSYFVNPEIFSKYNGLPIISMVTDPANLFDKKTGIYTYDNFKYHGAEWERPVHVELFEGDGRLAFSQDMGMRVHGLSGREYAQKSFRLYPRGSLGTDEPILGYDLFEGLALDVDGAPITAFHNFILRNCGDGWNKASIRDTLIQRVCGQAQGFGAAYQAGRQCVAFIDGEFWGIYNIRENYHVRNYADEFHLDRYKIQTVKKSSVMVDVEIADGGEEAEAAYNEMRGFFNNMPRESFKDDDVYAAAGQYVDMDNLVDVFVAYMFWGNRDWPINNYRMWRYAGPVEAGNPYTDGRWRLVLNDFDIAWVVDVNNSIPAEFLTSDGSAEHENVDAINMYLALLENEEFLEKFLDRCCDLMNTAFTPEAVFPILEGMHDNIEPVFAEHEARFPRNPTVTAGRFETEVDETKAYIYGRPQVMRDQLRWVLSLAADAPLGLIADGAEGSFEINGISLEDVFKADSGPGKKWDGVYFAGSTQEVAVAAKEGYRFEKFIVTETSGAGDGKSAAREYTDNPLQLKMPEGGCTVEAVFAK